MIAWHRTSGLYISEPCPANEFSPKLMEFSRESAETHNLPQTIIFLIINFSSCHFFVIIYYLLFVPELSWVFIWAEDCLVLCLMVNYHYQQFLPLTFPNHCKNRSWEYNYASTRTFISSERPKRIASLLSSEVQWVRWTGGCESKSSLHDWLIARYEIDGRNMKFPARPAIITLDYPSSASLASNTC